MYSTDSIVRVPRAPAFAALASLGLLLFSGVALGDEFEQFAKARNAYEAGVYAEAVSRFEALLTSEPKNPALVLETHKLLAVSYLFVGDEEAAKESFIELLTLSPQYELDPMLFPIEVVDFFTEVKAGNDERITALSKARADEEAARRAAEEERRLEELEKLKRNVYIERNRKENSLFVAILPLGIGQFQNGDDAAGGVFLGLELLLGAGAVVTYALHESLRDEAETPFGSASDRERYEDLEAGYRIANQSCLVALAVVGVAGLIDALYHYEEETVTWDRVDEEEVPERLRHQRRDGIAVAPFATGSSVGLGATGTF